MTFNRNDKSKQSEEIILNKLLTIILLCFSVADKAG